MPDTRIDAGKRNLGEQLEDARAHVALLEQAALNATCSEVGHKWQSIGGKNCGCHPDAQCSVPVHQCERCKDYDYGYNDDAAWIIANCEQREELLAERRP